MLLADFRKTLKSHPAVAMQFMLPGGEFSPSHFHVTEVGRVQKDFIDCGGTRRKSVACVLQTLIAHDFDHRLPSSKLETILNMASVLFDSNEIPIEVEYEGGVISQYPILECEVTPAGLLFHLGGKHADCLAKDRCGLGPALTTVDCSAPGCC